MQFIGDVHAGKRFETGVPLHRRGDRERMVLAQFKEELFSGSGPVVQAGDIFDKPVISTTVLMEVAMALREAAKIRPVAILRGNHDASRDSSRVSSFAILTELVRPYGVVVADEKPVVWYDVCLIPWSPWLTAKEMVENHTDLIGSVDTVVGHWDVVMGDSNQLPAAELLALGVKTAVTGHDHNGRKLDMDGLRVIVTGSMQPYSHGEDPNGRMYVTLQPSEIEAAGDLTNKCVRILLEPGEEFNEQIDCLQLTRTRAKVEEQELEAVEFEAFDFNALLDKACEQTGLTIKDQVVRKFEEERAKSG